MARDFNSTNATRPNIRRIFYRVKWETQLYDENNGLGPNVIRNDHFVESIHYGLIDHQNNSIIPNEDYIVNTQHGRVLDFVADSYSLMRLNWTTAVQKGLVSTEGSAFGNLNMVGSYQSPRVKYGEYLGNILRLYNETQIPNVIGITNITSYEDYVKNFFKLILQRGIDIPITMTRWNTSPAASILDTGLSFSYADIPFDADQQKIDQIVDHPSYAYFKNLCLNMGFSISHRHPNILIYEASSPATKSIRSTYGIYNLDTLFNDRFIKTYTIDNELLYNNINIYYNKFVLRNPQTKVVTVECGKTNSYFIRLQTVPLNYRPYNEKQELSLYCRLRNVEEGNPYPPQKIRDIIKKANYFLKKVDKTDALRYINSEFRDQVWNKNHGYHDLKQKLSGKTTTQAQRNQVGAVRSRGGSSSSY